MAMRDEVDKQLNNMIQFIHEEAREKSEEIRLKAEEEFSVEKTNLIQAQKEQINLEFEEKLKKLETQRKIAYSNQLNQSRLAQHKAKEEAIQTIFTEVQGKLGSLSKNSDKYKSMLENLIMQGLLQMMEQEVSIICREEDHQMVEGAAANASKRFHEKTNIKPKINIETNHRLAPSTSQGKNAPTCAGGVVLTAREGSIMCNNTLEQRLLLASELMLPEIRMALFGRSESRKFLA